MFYLPFILHAIDVSALSHEGRATRFSVNPRCSHVWVLVR
jgi:hypothetical protein